MPEVFYESKLGFQKLKFGWLLEQGYIQLLLLTASLIKYLAFGRSL